MTIEFSRRRSVRCRQCRPAPFPTPEAALRGRLVAAETCPGGTRVIRVPSRLGLVRAERLRRDVAAYRRVPPTDDEIALAGLADTASLADDTDWEALYAEDGA